MSRAFTKEDGWQEPVVAPRAALPAGVPNYVTPRGLVLLREEHAALESRRAQLDTDVRDEDARRARRTVLTRQIGELAARLASAEIVDPARQPHDAVRFGARVTFARQGAGQAPRSFQIVGVDEANPAEGRIAFVAPLARAVLGKRMGETIEFRGERLKIEGIGYDAG
jgi:transcription elongation factor GreB